jgi:hypothetical protein
LFLGKPAVNTRTTVHLLTILAILLVPYDVGANKTVVELVVVAANQIVAIQKNFSDQ